MDFFLCLNGIIETRKAKNCVSKEEMDFFLMDSNGFFVWSNEEFIRLNDSK
jgi:hypothetical protein